MLRYKLNRKPLIIAAMVILLCLACLSGATFALFTSDPNDGTIGVIATAGSIDVDIVDEANEDLSLVGTYLEFQTTVRYPDYRFEPGAVVYTQGFKVRNRGDIPINFRLSVCDDPETSNIDIETFHEAFEVWIVENTIDLSSAQKPIDFIDSVGPKQCSSDTYYLVIRMKETADNTFQNCYFTGIGVTVYAVQGNVEIEE